MHREDSRVAVPDALGRSWRSDDEGQRTAGRDGATGAGVLADANRGRQRSLGQSQPGGQPGASRDESDGCDGASVAESASARRQELRGRESWALAATSTLAGPARWPSGPGQPQHAWEPPRVLRRAESGVGIVPNGVSAGLVRHRRRALAALGNAVVPQVAYVIAQAIKDADQIAED